jgi:large subunit ribosomal protein L5
MQTPRLLEKYRTEIIPAMMQEFNCRNRFQVPRLIKIVVNMGIGEAISEFKILEKAMDELSLITGQRPVIRRSKKAIAGFKLKKGQPVGCKVTLRGKMMYEFLDRLVNVAIPRIKDFRGLSESSFDEAGNFSFGLSEQTIFPEVDYDKIQKIQGMDITICLQTRSKKEAKRLLELFGVPFAQKGNK